MPHLTFQYITNIEEYLDVDEIFVQLHRCLFIFIFLL